ncbi:unnamed protein product [Rhizoctonia solani]|uniref:RING-type domain-containing protein n=1 Tax=Rhizoctonia solani TaxID=456999 RepID=A0A8H3GKN5_9AGAM|nr:unnamed protein product [Rhizoctonia solani]
MHGSSDDEHEGEIISPPAPPAPTRTPPASRNVVNRDQTATSCTQTEGVCESTQPKLDNKPNEGFRSMAAPPKTAKNCSSDTPSSSSQAHMGPTSPPAPPAPSPDPLPSIAMSLPNTTENESLPPTETLRLRPSLLLPLLRCALCRLLLEAPTTLNCGHTLCSKHMTEARTDDGEGPSLPVRDSFVQCPVEGCKPRQPVRVCVLGRLNELDSRAGVTFTPAAQHQHTTALSESSSGTSPLRHVVKLDVTVSKLLEAITTAARRSSTSTDAHTTADTRTPDSRTHRGDSPATDEDEGTAIGHNSLTQGRSSAHDRTQPTGSASPSRSDRASSQSPTRPRKKPRTHPPAHTPTGLPDPSPSTSFEKDLLNELTCEICFMLLCNPITTPCQHTFCSTCLERSLDHSTKCPLCRLDLPPNAYFYQHAHNEVIVQIIAKAFPTLLEERVAIADTDGRDSRLDTPIFVCQLSYPGMPTLLHFFEPRYRLMLRRCLASPTPRFGMVMPRQSANNTDGNDFGTMLEIKNVQMLSDGRSMVETYGTFRFRILERGTLDGYLVGRIERIDDYPPDVEAEIERIAMMNPREGDITLRGIERSNQELVNICRRFLDQLRNGTAPWVVQRLNNTYGPMPNDVASFSFWVALASPWRSIPTTLLMALAGVAH